MNLAFLISEDGSEIGLKKSRFYTGTSEKDVKRLKLKKIIKNRSSVRIRKTCRLTRFYDMTKSYNHKTCMLQT